MNDSANERQIQMNPGIAPMPAPPENDFFKFRITTEDLLEELDHRLKGEILTSDDGRNYYYKKIYEPWCNHKFINTVIGIVYGFGANRNTILGNLKNKEICYRCNYLWKRLARLLFTNYKEFGIQKEMRSLIIKLIVDTVHSSLSRSEDGWESEKLSTATQKYEVHSDNNKSRNTGSFFQFLKPRKEAAGYG